MILFPGRSLPYLNSVSEISVSEKLLTGYMEKYGEFSREEQGEIVEIMRVSSPDDKLINSFLTILIKIRNIQVFFMR